MPKSLPVRVKPVRISSGEQKNVIYPRVFDMRDKEMERSINQQIIDETQGLIDQQADEMATPIIEMDGSFEIKNNQRNVLSLLLNNYAYHYQAAHGMTYIESLTFDLEERRQCRLSDLFKPGSNYVARLTELVNEQIEQRDIQTFNEHVEVRPEQDFYIADKTLVIYFQLYDITPYVFGFPMFPISVYAIMDIINEDGPLGRMAVNN
ncbi:DUF3298 and DUF4163 domain-containing protein [Lentibacillus sp. CBA3610]|uniref:DUF3298 and DUF4163 domain-containing protein n=1 Tax=Lentibacillus sp. CBA3610 TaxID=2518176 RepID=UPI001594E866|nr:DUF3298 and DUF4163 domain-containing protein [Lentibacillus sp. CBA3610]QKY68398.1 DUF3298/DUF4163 domain-containing protein [Lentibacillus sp. CBA3610]